METVITAEKIAEKRTDALKPVKFSKTNSISNGTSLPPLKSASLLPLEVSDGSSKGKSLARDSILLYPSKSASVGTPVLAPTLSQYTFLRVSGNIGPEAIINLSSKSNASATSAIGDSKGNNAENIAMRSDSSTLADRVPCRINSNHVNLADPQGPEDVANESSDPNVGRSLSAGTTPSTDPSPPISPTAASEGHQIPLVATTEITSTMLCHEPVVSEMLSTPSVEPITKSVVLVVDHGDQSSILSRRQVPSLAPLQTAIIKDVETPATIAVRHSTEEASSLDVLFNFLSQNAESLHAMESVVWKEFSTVTKAVYNRETDHDKPDLTIIDMLTKFKFSPDTGWDDVRGKLDIKALVQSCAKVYLTNKSENQENDTPGILTVPNIKSLSFLPNVLYTNFSSTFGGQACSTSIPSAVLLADISGFSKYAGSKCQEGSKGLDVLHKVTSDFLGLFVRTVYLHGGDGEFGRVLINIQICECVYVACMQMC